VKLVDSQEGLWYVELIFIMTQQPQWAKAKAFLLLLLLSHTQFDALHSVGLLWTSDQPIAGLATWQHATLTTDRQSPLKKSFKTD